MGLPAHGRMPYLNVTPIGMPEEVGFNPHVAFSGCKLCGAVYQSDLDRKPNQSKHEELQALIQRRNWTKHHAATHTDAEHRSLALSGRFCTPEASYKLAAFGVISIEQDSETTGALAEAPRLPTDSPEGV